MTIGRLFTVMIFLATTALGDTATKGDKKGGFWGEVKKGGKWAGKVGEDVGTGTKKIFSGDGKKKDQKKKD